MLMPTRVLSAASEPMASLIGTQLALLHLADVIHGDLTTSNMMLRPSASGAYDLVRRSQSFHGA